MYEYAHVRMSQYIRYVFFYMEILFLWSFSAFPILFLHYLPLFPSKWVFSIKWCKCHSFIGSMVRLTACFFYASQQAKVAEGKTISGEPRGENLRKHQNRHRSAHQHGEWNCGAHFEGLGKSRRGSFRPAFAISDFFVDFSALWRSRSHFSWDGMLISIFSGRFNIPKWFSVISGV